MRSSSSSKKNMGRSPVWALPMPPRPEVYFAGEEESGLVGLGREGVVVGGGCCAFDGDCLVGGGA